MALPKLEGEIVLSAATTVGTFAGSVITMPAGRYFLNTIGSGGATRTFLLELKNQLDTGPGGVWTVTSDDDADASTGKITIARNSNYTATWTSTNVRDLLGFTGNLTTAATSSFTSDNQAQYLWLPNCGRQNGLGPEVSDGAVESDYTMSMGTDGTVFAVGYSARYFDSMEFGFVWGQKCWKALEVVVNESAQRYYEMVIMRGLRTRYHKDRSNDSTLRTWVMEDAGTFNPRTVVPGWTDSPKSLFEFRYKVRKVS